MGCEHKNLRATKRTISSGISIVFLQCQECGSGRAGKKSEYKLDSLPDYDESIKNRYWEKTNAEYKAKAEALEAEHLIRSGAWWDNYSQYLSSANWKMVRRAVLQRDVVCQRCFVNASTQAHHLSYATYDRFGFSFPAECVGVCKECHERIHRKTEA